MDVTFFTSLFQEFLFVLTVFSIFFAITLRKGRQTTTNIILGLYIGLLLSMQFPYYDSLLTEVGSDSSRAVVSIGLFFLFTLGGTWFFTRVLPREYNEGAFEGFGAKVALALAGSILIILFSHHVLPIQEIINITTPLSTIFAQTEYFFWWLIAPLVIVFFVS